MKYPLESESQEQNLKLGRRPLNTGTSLKLKNTDLNLLLKTDHIMKLHEMAAMQQLVLVFFDGSSGEGTRNEI